MSLAVWFVTPAYRRLHVSEVCFAHRAWAIEEMREAGIDARCVVVADDENLELARSFGFDVHERANDYLGARWNDGYEYAARQGADFVVPIGSDSWIHPAYFVEGGLPDPEAREIGTSRYYSIVNESGSRLARLEIPLAGGVGPNVVPTRLLERCGYRPVREELQRGCDGSLMRTLGIHGRKAVSFRWVDIDPLQYFAFRTPGEQLNPYQLLARKYAVVESRRPWGELARMHPKRFVERARAVYQREAVAA